jgi:hypothetical protein
MIEYWYIWYRAYENGVMISEGRYHRSYRNRDGARKRAKKMWDKPVYNPLTNTTVEYQWKVGQVYPWNGVKGDRYT